MPELVNSPATTGGGFPHLQWKELSGLKLRIMMRLDGIFDKRGGFHPGQRKALEQIADAFGFSKNYICQLFKKHFDTTFSIYITKKRMIRAKEMLADKTLSVKEIAYDLGYADYHHFYRTFKNYYGYSPKENR